MPDDRSIRIFDTTLRDGEQSPGASMNRTEKLEVAQALEKLGVDVIEAGFPIASPGDFESVRDIAAAIKKMGSADLIIAATESSDGYTGTVPEQLAEVMGLPSVTFAKKVEINGSTLKADRQTESGYDEVECPLPAVISVTAGVVEPRYPSFKGIMAAKSKPIDTFTASDLGITPTGWAGAGQKIVAVTQAEARQAGEVIEDDGNAFNKIVSFLENLKAI